MGEISKMMLIIKYYKPMLKNVNSLLVDLQLMGGRLIRDQHHLISHPKGFFENNLAESKAL